MTQPNAPQDRQEGGQRMPTGNGFGVPITNAEWERVTSNPALFDRYCGMVENISSLRKEMLSRLFDERRNIDYECGYPESTSSGYGNLNPELYRTLYEREAIAWRAVRLMPLQSWQVTPLVYEDEDPEVATPFEEGWDNLGTMLRGEQCWYAQEQGSPVWDALKRADILSGIGHFSVLLIGFADGKDLDQPVDGVVSYDPTGNAAAYTRIDWKDLMVANDRGKVVGLRRVFNGIRKPVYPTRPRATPDPTCNEMEVDSYPVYETVQENGPMRGLPKQSGRAKYGTMPTLNANGITDNSLPPMPTINKAALPGAGWGNSSTGAGSQGATAPTGIVGTDAQYTGVQAGPTEFPSRKPAPPNSVEVLYLRPFDESLVQIVQYESNVRNPRFGMPVMYRITLNDPRDQHGGIGLPMATVRVHWSRVIHIPAPNRGSSQIFGTPELRPILNRVLDLRKVYGADAEGFWQYSFPKLALSTHPQLGGDVKVDVPSVQNMLEDIRNGFKKEMLLMGMGASTVSGSVADPTPHINIQIEAICIAKGCPVRIFKGAERGELASTQDDSQWNDNVRECQWGRNTPDIIVPLTDRMISAGVVPPPGRSPLEEKGMGAPPGAGSGAEHDEEGDDDEYDDENPTHVPDPLTMSDPARRGKGITNANPEGYNQYKRQAGFEIVPGVKSVKKAPDHEYTGTYHVTLDNGDVHSIYRDAQSTFWHHTSPKDDSHHFSSALATTKGDVLPRLVKRQGEFIANAFPPKPGGAPKPPSPTPQEGGAPGAPGGAAPPPKPPNIDVKKTDPVGYSIEWPDLDSLGDKDRAQVALQITQALAAYVAGGVEAVMPVFEYLVNVCGFKEELVTPMLLKIKAAEDENMTIPPAGEEGHPATPPPPPPTEFIDGATGKSLRPGPDGKPIIPPPKDKTAKPGDGAVAKNNDRRPG